MFVCPSIRLSVYLSVLLSVCLFICLSILLPCRFSVPSPTLSLSHSLTHYLFLLPLSLSVSLRLPLSLISLPSQVAGVPLKDLSDILPTALILGYGEKVCSFLLLLCGLALIKTNHTWSPLTYKSMVRDKTVVEGKSQAAGPGGVGGAGGAGGWVENVSTRIDIYMWTLMCVLSVLDVTCVP